jgi:radical SAM protein with 4Fe4S-binding SPASM domain
VVKWLKKWGKKPQKNVIPYWWPPTLIFRQALSAIVLGALTNWRKLPSWFLNFGFKCLPGAAGSKGMGCIGFPSHPVIEITKSCNLKCIHCHVPHDNNDPELSTNEVKGLLDQLALGFTNTIATNATLINDHIAQKLHDHGVVIVAVSLDGFNAKTHDMVRGLPGSFEAAIRGIKALNRTGILLHVNITAMSYNISQIKRITKLVSELGAGILLMYQLVPIGRGKQISKASLDLKSNEKLIKFITAAQSNTNVIIEPVAGPQYWSYILKRSKIEGGLSLRLAENIFHGCSAARGFVYIKPNGEVWPCPFIEVNCGNIRETPFSLIWYNSKVLNQLRNREKLLKGHCGECTYKKLCGGCRGKAWAETGDYLAEDPSCFIYNDD